MLAVTLVRRVFVRYHIHLDQRSSKHDADGVRSGRKFCMYIPNGCVRIHNRQGLGPLGQIESV